MIAVCMMIWQTVALPTTNEITNLNAWQNLTSQGVCKLISDPTSIITSKGWQPHTIQHAKFINLIHLCTVGHDDDG